MAIMISRRLFIRCSPSLALVLVSPILIQSIICFILPVWPVRPVIDYLLVI